MYDEPAKYISGGIHHGVLHLSWLAILAAFISKLWRHKSDKCANCLVRYVSLLWKVWSGSCIWYYGYDGYDYSETYDGHDNDTQIMACMMTPGLTTDTLTQRLITSMVGCTLSLIAVVNNHTHQKHLVPAETTESRDFIADLHDQPRFFWDGRVSCRFVAISRFQSCVGVIKIIGIDNLWPVLLLSKQIHRWRFAPTLV